MDSTTFTVEQINRAIEAMVKAQAKAVQSVEPVIVMALWDSNVNESADVANMLVNNLRKGLKKQAIVDLLQSFGNLAYISGSFKFFEANKGWGADEVKAIKAAAKDWESFKPKAKVVESLDVAEAIDALARKIEKAKKDGIKIVGEDLVREILKAKAIHAAKQYQ